MDICVQSNDDLANHHIDTSSHTGRTEKESKDLDCVGKGGGSG